ncbi:MAG: hypothetical protein M1814_005935 [Vezdaea aestivalis]|nr:MAG: hypothetical protein M1814_005935 [Vezdaea aestivalis]
MAVSTEQPTELAEVINRLVPEDIPAKLRCSICNTLALDAFRLLCCSQSICEDCHASLPSTCPVCEHSPLSNDSATPNKPLRTTIRAFLKTKVAAFKKADASKATTVSQAPTQTSTEPSEKPTTSEVASLSTVEPNNTSNALDLTQALNGGLQDVGPDAPQIQDIPQPSVEAEVHPNTADDKPNGTVQERQIDHVTTGAFQDAAGDDTTTQPGASDTPTGNNGQQNWTSNGNFHNPMMQAMQAGMGTQNWGTYNNTMGMPGMTMDMMGMPQGMFGGFGGPGMGMDGMNMGMGMAFNGSQGPFTGWNGQPAWNSGQDNFNPIANGTHVNGMGSFDAHAGYQSNPGFGQFNQMQQQQFPNSNFQGNFHQGPGNFHRGRGRGYARGRGYHNAHAGYNHQPHNHSQTSQAMHRGPSQDGSQHVPSNKDQNIGEDTANNLNTDTVPPSITEDPKAHEGDDSANIAQAAFVDEVDESGSPKIKANPLGDTEPRAERAVSPVKETLQVPETVPLSGEDDLGTYSASNGLSHNNNTGSLGDVDFPHDSSVHVNDNLGGDRTSTRQTNRVEAPPKMPVEPRGQGVVGAPTGPKALRDGRPNIGYRGRGSGFGAYGRGGQYTGAHAPPRNGYHDNNVDRRRSLSRSRSPEQSESNHHRRHRHRTESPVSSDNSHGHRRDRHQRRSKKQRDDYEAGYNTRIKQEATESRSPSPIAKSSVTRHHRDAEYEGSRKHKRSHKSHRDRDSSRDRRHRHRSRSSDDEAREERRERRRDKDKGSRDDGDRDRSNRRDLHYENKAARREEKHRSKRSTADKGRDSKVAALEQNSHDQEREARNRERLMKEQQRRDELLGGPKTQSESYRKRGRETDANDADEHHRSRRSKRSRSRRGIKEEEETNGRRTSGKKRRVTYKYEDDESDEARAVRVEKEREASRWE